MIIYLLAIICVFLYVIYAKLNKIYSYWDKKGVKGPKPKPIVGNMGGMLTKTESFNTIMTRMYDQYPTETFVGIYQGLSPTLILRDPDLIKKVLIKDFPMWTDRGFHTSDEPMSKNLFLEEGDNWRVLRQRLSPIFTSGKLKQMMPLLDNCVGEYMKYLEEVVNDPQPREIRHLNMKYTLKGITTVAFGLDINTFDDDKSRFVEMADKLFEPNVMRLVPMLVNKIIPGLADKLGLKTTSKDVSEFFMNLVCQIRSQREGKPKVRKDFMDLMIEMKEQGTVSRTNEHTGDVAELEITDEFMVAQAVLFYAAGFETSSGTMSYILYELALNPEVQDRCFEEVSKTFKQHGGSLPYDAISEMKYLNMVMDEALRKHPVAGGLFRRCVVDYHFEGTHLTVDAGTGLMIPVLSLHNDPKYFPNPDKFDPERFLPERRSQIRDGAYLPFGDGPRNCIGMRFARVQSLVGIAHFVLRFRVSPCEKTVKRVRQDPQSFTITSIDGLWLNIERRR